MHRVVTGVLVLIAAIALGGQSLAAADMTILASNGIKTVLDELLPQFEKTTQHTVAVTYGVSAALMRQIEQGETFDVAILAAAQIDGLIKQGKIAADTRVAIARSPMALAVRSGSGRPDIRTTAALTRTLLESTSVTFAKEGAGGVYFTQLMQRLGLSERLASRLRPTATGAEATSAVARGDAQFAVLPMSEILPVAGIEVLGTFPADVQDYVVMVGGVRRGSTKRANASELMTFLTASSVRPVLDKKGMQPASAPATR